MSKAPDVNVCSIPPSGTGINIESTQYPLRFAGVRPRDGRDARMEKVSENGSRIRCRPSWIIFNRVWLARVLMYSFERFTWNVPSLNLLCLSIVAHGEIAACTRRQRYEQSFDRRRKIHFTHHKPKHTRDLPRWSLSVDFRWVPNLDTNRSQDFQKWQMCVPWTNKT